MERIMVFWKIFHICLSRISEVVVNEFVSTYNRAFISTFIRNTDWNGKILNLCCGEGLGLFG
jgi:hypothetical protein